MAHDRLSIDQDLLVLSSKSELLNTYESRRIQPRELAELPIQQGLTAAWQKFVSAGVRALAAVFRSGEPSPFSGLTHRDPDGLDLFTSFDSISEFV